MFSVCLQVNASCPSAGIASVNIPALYIADSAGKESWGCETRGLMKT